MSEPEHANPFRKLTFGGNQEIFTEGQRGDVMYFVEEGQVRIWTGRPPNDRTLATVGPGGFFGEMALVDGKPRSANATSMGFVAVRAIPGTTLRRKLANADPFLKALVRILVENLRSTSTTGR
ncbi:Crp/Fnr family transcriptional regulator [Marinibaculum pumilum]|uniref:Crp/Fnr family transcriptional regulator n=1 Tax=Marinibaculum pumilum TaxID=1766165 RepID=A0ABV7L5U0_9PROT